MDQIDNDNNAVKKNSVLPSEVTMSPESPNLSNRINFPSHFPSVHSNQNNISKRLRQSSVKATKHDITKIIQSSNFSRHGKMSVRRPAKKTGKLVLNTKQRENHLLHRRMKSTTTVSVDAADIESNKKMSKTSSKKGIIGDMSTLEYCLCQTKPYYNPYVLRRVLKETINKEKDIYFIKGNTGVTLYQNGEDPIFTNNDEWYQQYNTFRQIKEKTYFLTFRLRIIFDGWKKLFRSNKFKSAGDKIKNNLFIFKPIFNKCIFDVHKLLFQCRSIITHFSLKDMPKDGYTLEAYINSHQEMTVKHHEVIKLYNGNINEVVLQCCTAIYVENDIPILGHVNLIDISQRRNLQALLKRFIKLVESYIQASVEEFIIARESQIASFFPDEFDDVIHHSDNNITSNETKEQEEAGTSATGSNEEEDATDCISFKRVSLHVYGKVNFKGNVMFELKPSFKSIHKSFQDIFDEFLQM